MAIWSWSRTSADANGTADATIDWAEGMAPSAVNNSARAMMLATAQYRDDIAGGTVTTGAAAAYALTTFSNFTSAGAMANQMVAFTPHVTNAIGPVTISVDSVANIPLRSSPGKELPAGVLIAGTPYVAVYNQTDAALYLHSFYGSSPYLIPIGGMMDFIGNTSPNAQFAFPIGQAVSRTTYATLFSLVGTTYGVGDGSTTFNLPDVTGRVTAMQEASASRLTSAFFGGNSTVLGAVGGNEAHRLTIGEMPTFTPSGTIGGTITTNPTFPIQHEPTSHSTPAGGGSTSVPSTNADVLVFSSAGLTFTGTPIGGNNQHVTVQPTIIVNKILRVI